MQNDNYVVTNASFNQLDSSMRMLQTLVEVCNDNVWYQTYNGLPFWYHVYHVAYFIDYWLRPDFDNNNFKSMVFDERIPPEFEHPVDSSLFITRADMLEYINRLFAKVKLFFSLLDDNRLAVPVIEGQENLTYADVIMTQIRHIMYNIGYLNGILRSLGLPESDWYAYNEEE